MGCWTKKLTDGVVEWENGFPQSPLDFGDISLFILTLKKNVVWSQSWGIGRPIHASIRMLTIMQGNYRIIEMFTEVIECISRSMGPGTILHEPRGVWIVLQRILNRHKIIPNYLANILCYSNGCCQKKGPISTLEEMVVQTITFRGCEMTVRQCEDSVFPKCAWTMRRGKNILRRSTKCFQHWYRWYSSLAE